MLKRFQAAGSPNVKTKLCTEIEHIVWIGGDSLISHLFEEVKFLQFLANTVAHRADPDLLRLQSLQTMAVICRISGESANKFRENGGLRNVMEVVCGDDLELKRWAAHSLFWMCTFNNINQKEVLSSQEVMQNLALSAKDEGWYKMAHNDANELLRMLALH